MGIVGEELLKSLPTTDQHLQGRLCYLPVSSTDAAEITRVRLWDLITRSGGGSKLLGHTYILTLRASSGRRLWDKNRGNSTLNLVGGGRRVHQIILTEPKWRPGLEVQTSLNHICVLAEPSWFIPNKAPNIIYRSDPFPGGM